MNLRALLIPSKTHAAAAMESIRASLAFLTLLVMVLAWPAWLNHDARFPLVPAVPGFPSLPPGVDFILPLLILIGSAAILLGYALPAIRRFHRPLHIALAALLALGCLGDLTRCHPWLYQIAWMHGFFALLHKPQQASTLLTTLGIMIAGIYFWSGFHKLNPEYIGWVLPWLLKPFGHPMQEPIAGIGYATAIAEAAVALLIWFPKTRKWGVGGIIFMHLFILASIGPLGHNWNPVVWPWNLAMPFWAWIIFVRNAPTLPDWKPWATKIGLALTTLVFALLPGLHTIGAVNGYLAFSLYSGKIPEATIFLDTDQMMQMPKEARAYGDIQGDQAYIAISGWTIEVTGLSAFPSVHYYKSTYQVLCHRYPALANSYMVIKIPGWGTPEKVVARCEP